VLIADDHPLFRQGVRALLATEPTIEVVGEASDGVAAVMLAEETGADVVLMDLQMPGGSGLDAIRELTRRQADSRVLVLTMFDDDDSVFTALRSGAHGYVLKDADDDELLRSIVTVGGGGAIYSAGVARRMSALFTSLDERRTQPDDLFPTLTASERRVLGEMARGLNNDAIAVALGYSRKTIRNYVSIIFAKLHVADRAQAIILAREHGLG
jgi:DNA-binding NarL/FixJ family response regulator